jgi:hypothetical protein
MPEFDQRSPMVGRRTGLHRNQARRQFGKKRRQPAAPELPRDDDPAVRVDCVDLENVLKPDRARPA